jgi:hypothetical protein
MIDQNPYSALILAAAFAPTIWTGPLHADPVPSIWYLHRRCEHLVCCTLFDVLSNIHRETIDSLTWSLPVVRGSVCRTTWLLERSVALLAQDGCSRVILSCVTYYCNHFCLIHELPETSRHFLCRPRVDDYIAERLSYNVLSYTWGDYRGTRDIGIDRSKTLISKNLWVTLCHLRHRSHAQILWIDSIYINQSNSEEKN